MKKNEIDIKLTAVGGPYIGKTAFLLYLCDDKLPKSAYEKYYNSHGADYSKKRIIYKKQIFSFNLWDTAGTEKYRKLSSFFMEDADVVLFFYNSLSRESLEIAKEFIKASKERGIYNLIPCLICSKYELNMGNKFIDIIKDEEVLEYAEENNIIFSHISIFDQYENGINELFIKILDRYMKTRGII